MNEYNLHNENEMFFLCRENKLDNEVCIYFKQQQTFLLVEMFELMMHLFQLL